jgi:hypothetical protein
MGLYEALEIVKFDKRLLEWHIKQGIVTQAEMDKHVKSLPDSKDMSVPLDFDFDAYSNGSFPDEQ